MTMQIVTKTKSLGRKIAGSDDHWRWCDDGGASVVRHLERGRLARWQTQRSMGEEGGRADPAAENQRPDHSDGAPHVDG